MGTLRGLMVERGTLRFSGRVDARNPLRLNLPMLHEREGQRTRPEPAAPVLRSRGHAYMGTRH
jgi:hypothetical protein